MTDFTKTLQDTFGEKVVTLRGEIPEKYWNDWAGLPATEPLALARPSTTEEVSGLLAACHAAGVPVVPQGGLTGISGAVGSTSCAPVPCAWCSSNSTATSCSSSPSDPLS